MTSREEVCSYCGEKGHSIQECPKWRTKEVAVAIEREAATFTEPLLGQCRYQFFYLTNELYGGYSAKCEKGSISASFVNPVEVIDLAEKVKMNVHLAGDAWEEIGRKGYGEFVPPSEARTLLKQLSEKRGFKVHSSSNPFVYIENIEYYGEKVPLYAVKGDLAVKVPQGYFVNISETSKISERELPKHLMYIRDKYAIKKTWQEVLDKLYESVGSHSFSPEKAKRVYINPAELPSANSLLHGPQEEKWVEITYLDLMTGKKITEQLTRREEIAFYQDHDKLSKINIIDVKRIKKA